MQFLLYSEINILCILFFCLILFKVLTGIDMHLDKRLFIFALIGTLVMFASDLVWILIDKEFLRVSVDINYLVSIIYYIFNLLHLSQILLKNKVFFSKLTKFCLIFNLLLLS